MASTSSSRKGSIKLPTELKRIVCTLLPHATLKKVRLVNKEWGNVAASLLFRDLKTDLVETEQRNFDTLLVPGAEGFLDNVTGLYIHYPRDGTVVPDANFKMLQLLCVLPRNCMMQFRSDVPLERSTLGLLFRTQRHLRLLNVPIEHRGLPSSPPGKDYVSGSLAHLEVLTIFATGHERDGYGTWLPHLVALRKLRITRPVDCMESKPAFNGWAPVVPSPTLKLRRLHLVNVQLPETPAHMVMFLDLPSVEELCIDGCVNSGPLLGLVAQRFTGCLEPSALRVFERRRERFEGRLQHLEDLLSSVSGLEGIAVDADGADPLPVACLQFHGKSLKYLLLGFSKDRRQGTIVDQRTDSLYAVSDVAQLVDMCPNLQVLGISLTNIDFTGWGTFKMVGISFGPTGNTPAGRQIAQTLKPLAQLPKLRTLCLTHVPYMPLSNYGRLRLFRHKNIATEMFSFMTAHGSPLRYIVFHPAGRGPTRIMTNDETTSPDFYFRKGKITTDDGSKYEEVVALPISREEFEDFEPFHAAVTSF